MSASSEVRIAWPRSAAASATCTSTISGWEILPIVTPISFARSAVSSSMITGPSGPRPALISRPTFAWRGPPRDTWAITVRGRTIWTVPCSASSRMPSSSGARRSSAMNAPASKTNPLTQHARCGRVACFMLTVCLVCGTESRTEARLSVLVQVADLRTQGLDDGFQLRARLKKFQALGDQRGHRFRTSFLDLVSGPVVKFLAERDADLLGHTWNHTAGRSASCRLERGIRAMFQRRGLHARPGTTRRTAGSSGCSTCSASSIRLRRTRRDSPGTRRSGPVTGRARSARSRS